MKKQKLFKTARVGVIDYKGTSERVKCLNKGSYGVRSFQCLSYRESTVFVYETFLLRQIKQETCDDFSICVLKLFPKINILIPLVTIIRVKVVIEVFQTVM